MINRKVLISFLILIISNCTYAQKRSFISFKNGQVQFGQSYLDLNLDNFKIAFQTPDKAIKSAFVKGTLKWEKNSEGLFIPSAELLVQMNRKAWGLKQPFVHFGDKIYSPSLLKNKGIFSFALTVPLFQFNHIEVFKEGEHFNTLYIEPITSDKVKHHYIDPSCTPYHLEIKDFDEYLSISCELSRLGKIGSERPKLKLLWVTPNYFAIDGKEKANVTTFTSSGSAEVILKNHSGKKKKVTFHINLPKKLHRLKTALGLGPYQMLSRVRSDEELGGIAHEEKGITGNLTLYGRFDLTLNTSLRFFDSFSIKGKEIFNNSGLYFAYDLARVYDDRIQIVALLGTQYLTHSTDFGTSFNKLIAPQGGEVTFHHPLGLRNYVLGAGAFYASANSYDYINAWLRFGKKTTYELNYIKYNNDSREVSVAGISVIFPLFSLF